jgi:hypothetical protein
MSTSSPDHVTITGPDYDKSHVEAGRGCARYYFILSDTPSRRWVEIFDQKWAEYRRRRAEEAGTPAIAPGARIEGSNVALSCALHDERLQTHLDELKRIARETNEALHEEEIDYESKEDEYKQLILNNLVRLNFD